jgi:hypothetical protein
MATTVTQDYVDFINAQNAYYNKITNQDFNTGGGEATNLTIKDVRVQAQGAKNANGDYATSGAGGDQLAYSVQGPNHQENGYQKFDPNFNYAQGAKDFQGKTAAVPTGGLPQYQDGNVPPPSSGAGAWSTKSAPIYEKVDNGVSTLSPYFHGSTENNTGEGGPQGGYQDGGRGGATATAPIGGGTGGSFAPYQFNQADTQSGFNAAMGVAAPLQTPYGANHFTDQQVYAKLAQTYNHPVDAAWLYAHFGHPVDNAWLNGIVQNPPHLPVAGTPLHVLPAGMDTSGHPVGSAGSAPGATAGTGGTPGAAGASASSPAGLSAGQRDAFSYLQGLLDQYGLGSLTKFVVGELTAGRSQNEIALDLQQTPEFKQAFPEIAARKAAGLPAIGPGEIVSYRNSATQLMRAAGLPKGFYDSQQDFANLLGSDVSLSELNDRINTAKDATYNIDPAAQNRLTQEFGMTPGSGSLAAYFLDPHKALPLLQRQVQGAQIGGAADQVGYKDLNNATALDLAQAGISAGQARQGFNVLGNETQLFNSLPGEQGSTIGQGQQLAAQFLGNTEGQQAIEGQRRNRQAAFADGGGFATSQKGLGGLGTANSA